MLTNYLYDTYELVAVLEGLDTFRPFFLEMFFPDEMTFNSPEIIFERVEQDFRLAPFVSPLVEGKVIKDRGGIMRAFKPAYVKPRHVVDPERVFRRRAGEAVGGSLTPGQRRDAVIAENLRWEREAITRRWEWMAAQVLLTGKTTVQGDDYPPVVVDFGRDASLTRSLTGGARWTETTATPDIDIENWSVELEAPVTDIVMGRGAYRNLISNQRVLDLLKLERGRESDVQLDPDTRRYVAFKGSLGNVNIYVYTGYYHDSTYTKQMLIPDNAVILTSAALGGVRAFGAIISARAGYQAMSIYPRNWISDSVEIEFTESQSAPLMIPRRPNSSMAVTVY